MYESFTAKTAYNKEIHPVQAIWTKIDTRGRKTLIMNIFSLDLCASSTTTLQSSAAEVPPPENDCLTANKYSDMLTGEALCLKQRKGGTHNLNWVRRQRRNSRNKLPDERWAPLPILHTKKCRHYEHLRNPIFDSLMNELHLHVHLRSSVCVRHSSVISSSLVTVTISASLGRSLLSTASWIKCT